MFRLELNREMAWITFLGPGWEKVWHPVTDITGEQLEWSDDIMDHCRAKFNTQFHNRGNWISFGIAPTSQMILSNSVRTNM